MKVVLDWIKSNLVSVVFIVLMIAAVVAMPLLTRGMNANIREEVKKRAARSGELDRLEKTQINQPADPTAEPLEGVVNENLLAAYRKAVEVQQEDADRIYEAALAHNSKGRGVLMPELFPAPPLAEAEVLPQRFHERLILAYQDLLDRLGAGAPPDPAEIKELLQRRQAQFLTQMVALESVADLDEEQLKGLRQELTEARTSRYVQTAQSIGIFATLDALGPPGWDPSRIPGAGELFDWQWRFWIQEDIVDALVEANRGAASVIEAPVKQLIWAGIADHAVAAAGAGSAPGTPGGFSAGGFRGRPGAGDSGGGDGDKDAAAQAAPPDPRAEAKLDYRLSLTGRKSNRLYDVRPVSLALLVDPERVPQILDALARQNFMTVVDLDMSEADPFEALQQGFFFGSGAIARLTLTLETIWLREWTAPFMPEAVKRALGIPIAQPEPAESADAA
jgi:hypothetical protein